MHWKRIGGYGNDGGDCHSEVTVTRGFTVVQSWLHFTFGIYSEEKLKMRKNHRKMLPSVVPVQEMNCTKTAVKVCRWSNSWKSCF